MTPIPAELREKWEKEACEKYPHYIYGIHQRGAYLAACEARHREYQERVATTLVSFKIWYDSLVPSEKCTVWPPAGSGSGTGLYTMPDAELVDKFLRKLAKDTAALSPPQASPECAVFPFTNLRQR